MEASALKHVTADGLRGPTPLLRIQSDERLVALTRRGNQAAYEALVGRYQARLLAFCRHMLGSREDAEDVLQEVFAAAFNAMIADERPLNVRPWLYRIARNRSLNHLRRVQAIGVDSMDVHLSENGTSAADKVHRREEFRLLVEDVQGLPETQRTALLLREIDALSYDQIAEAMETTIPSVKSLLVRARVSLAESAEARQLTCDEVRDELGEVAEGLHRMTAPVRRHLRQCDRCAAFRKQLRQTNRALAAVFPVGPLLLLKKFVLAHLGTTPARAASAAAAAPAPAPAARARAARCRPASARWPPRPPPGWPPPRSSPPARSRSTSAKHRPLARHAAVAAVARCPPRRGGRLPAAARRGPRRALDDAPQARPTSRRRQGREQARRAGRRADAAQSPQARARRRRRSRPRRPRRCRRRAPAVVDLRRPRPAGLAAPPPAPAGGRPADAPAAPPPAAAGATPPAGGPRPRPPPADRGRRPPGARPAGDPPPAADPPRRRRPAARADPAP